MTATGWYTLAAAMIATCIAGLVAYAARLDGNGGHTHRNVRRRAVPFADPADRSDPDGAGYVGQLLDPPPGEPPWQDEDELDAGWWAQSAPPAAVEILTGPVRRIEQTGKLATTVLERVRDALHDMPPDGTTATFRPAAGVTMPVSDDPDTTGVQPVALRTWGKDATQLADELAARYLT